MDAEVLKMMRNIIPSLIEATSDAIDAQEPLSAQRVDIPLEDGSKLAVYLHLVQRKHAPLIVELHGGGFAIGDARKDDALCAWISRSWDVNVASVDYRLAPEHPYPAQLDDLCLALDWLRAQGGQYGIDINRSYLMGYSAGANLAASFCIKAARDQRKVPTGLIMFYPALDLAADPTQRPYRDIDLSADVMGTFNTWYLEGHDAKDPLISPVFATPEELAHLPKCVILPVVGDCLYDEAARFAEKLIAAHRDVAVHPIEDAYHGFVEDAANVEVYEATNLPDLIERRPAEYRELAARAVAGGIADFLGDPVEKLPFPGQISVERGEDGLMEAEPSR